MASSASRSVVPEALPSFLLIFHPLNQVIYKGEDSMPYETVHAVTVIVIACYKLR